MPNNDVTGTFDSQTGAIAIDSEEAPKGIVLLGFLRLPEEI